MISKSGLQFLVIYVRLSHSRKGVQCYTRECSLRYCVKYENVCLSRTFEIYLVKISSRMSSYLRGYIIASIEDCTFNRRNQTILSHYSIAVILVGGRVHSSPDLLMSSHGLNLQHNYVVVNIDSLLNIVDTRVIINRNVSTKYYVLST